MLANGLEKKTLDCDLSSLVLRDILQQFGIDSEFVILPEHIILRVGQNYFETVYYFDSSASLKEKILTFIFYNEDAFQKEYPTRHETSVSFLPIAYYNRAIAKIKKEDYRSAISDFNTAIQLNPNNAEAYYNRGAAREKTGDYKGAEADIARAKKLEYGKKPESGQ